MLGAIRRPDNGFFDALLADRFARHVSVRVMNHAAQLDLATYEDRVPRHAGARARAGHGPHRDGPGDGIDPAAGHYRHDAFGQHLLLFTVATAAARGSRWFPPSSARATPSCISLNIQQTPARRRLDYLRLIGASKESAKELKLFGLAPFITSEFSRLSDEVYEQNVALARRRLFAGALLSALRYGRLLRRSTRMLIYRTVNGDLSWGSLQFLAGALLGASGGIQLLFSTFHRRSVAVPDRSGRVPQGAASVQSRPHAIPAPRPMKDGIVFEDVSFLYPGNPRLVLDRVNLRIGLGERIAPSGPTARARRRW